MPTKKESGPSPEGKRGGEAERGMEVREVRIKLR